MCHALTAMEEAVDVPDGGAAAASSSSLPAVQAMPALDPPVLRLEARHVPIHGTPDFPPASRLGFPPPSVISRTA